MNKKKLEIKKTPLNGYMEEAYSLTVAITKESSYEWIYSNYIQLVFENPIIYDNQPVKFFKLSFKSGRVWDAECPLLYYDTITREMIEAMNIDIVDFICISIAHKSYVKIYLDEYFLPYRFVYKKIHYTHESLFTGFDYDKKELYGLAYVTDETGYGFKEFTVDMDVVRQAYAAPIDEGSQKERITLMSCNRERYYEFDKKAVKNSINEYMNSVQTDLKYAEINNPDENYIFGIRIYDALVDYFKNDSKSKSIIPLHIIFEHKKLMLDRILYMIDNQYINHDQGIIDDYLKIINEAYKCKLLFLKYSYTNTESTYNQLEKCINEIKAHDKELMTRLYLLLDEKVECKQAGYKYSRWGLWRDVAYPLNDRVCNLVEISFKLHIINNKSQGYIRITNEECLNNYFAPFILRFDVRKAEFYISDSMDKNHVILKNITCVPGNVYSINFIVDLDKRKYCVMIYDQNQLVKYENEYAAEVADKLQYINYLAVIHENSYRFAISELYCVD